MDEQDKKRQELESIQEELKTTGMSRRKFLNRLKVAGVGFGTFAVLGNEAANAHTGNAVSLQSSNDAIGGIIDDGRAQSAEGEGDENTKVAYRRYYRRYYRRGYRRYYSRYRRYYRRYSRYNYRRFYRRYGRIFF